MVHTIYKTTNLVNGKFYIGVHKTDDPQDEYLGSGKLIRLAVAKYGEQNFRKEILFEFSDESEAFKKEEELVEQNRGNPLSYNLRKGGAGGFDYMNRNGFSSIGGKHSWAGKKIKWEQNPESRRKQDEASRRNIAIAVKYVTREIILRNQQKAINAWRGRHHSEEYRSRKRVEVKGEKNPRYGKVWVNLGGIEEAIPSSELQSYLSLGWMKGRRKRYWVAPFVEIAKPRPFRLGKPTKSMVRLSKKKPRSEWKRKFRVWPSDDELLAIVAEIGQRALARQMGISNVAVHYRVKKMLGLRLVGMAPVSGTGISSVRTGEAQPDLK